MGHDRQRGLPRGVTGTLAHDRAIAATATTIQRSCSALGIDIEPATVLDEHLARMICRPEERHLNAHLVFVLKEGAYKAWSSLGGRMLGHWDVAVTVDTRGRNFRATILPDAISLMGRYAAVEDRYLDDWFQGVSVVVGDE